MTAAGVAHADCQALLGHKHGDITNLHYTDRKLKELKAHIDRVDYHLEVAYSAAHGFPIIVACRLDERERVQIDIELDDHGYACRVAWSSGDERVGVIVAPMRSWPGFSRWVEEPAAERAPVAAARLATALGDREPKFRSAEQLDAWEYLMSLA